MKSQFFLIVCFLFPLLLSCSNNGSIQTEPETIFIDLDEKNRPQLNIEIEDIIPIEISDNCLISWIGDFQFYNNRFYFLNNNRFKEPGLLVFNRDGSFLRKTGRGKGPGEMIEPFAFTINEEESQIFIHDQAQNPSHIFDLELNFIRQVKHEYIFMGDLHHVKQDTFLVFHHVPTTTAKTIDQKYYKYTIYTEDFSKEEHLDVLVNRDQSLHLLSSMSVYKDQVLFIVPYSLRVFQLVSGEAIVRYLLDFGKHGLTQDELSEVSDKEFRSLMTSGELVMPLSIFQTKEYLIFQIIYREKSFVFVQSLKKKRIYCLNDSNVLPNDFILRGVTKSGILYGYLEADRFIEFQESTGMYKSIKAKDEDNPFVILFTISK